MAQAIGDRGITFAVDAVEPATARLAECKSYAAIKAMVGSDIESCCDYHDSVVDNVDYQPLLAAVYLAFSQHRPLVLTPDAVWITIAQGIAHHMAIHGERLRSKLVAHQGKHTLTYEVAGWVAGSPENPWPEAFASWSGKIRDHVGAPLHDALICDFSTTGPIERSVSQIVMMDIFQHYFEYVLLCVCGIPSITLEGSVADWQRLRDKIEGLRIFDIDWWLEALRPICDQFVRASRGDVDLDHWQAICKLRRAYGGDIINGWVCKLFPYLRAYINGPCTRKNPIFESGEGMQAFHAPPGLSCVPFVWVDVPTRTEWLMEAIGGLVGVTQDSQTLALRAKVGWAVRPAQKMAALLRRLHKEHHTYPGAKFDPKKFERYGGGSTVPLPKDLLEFYHDTNGAEFISQGQPVCRIVPLEKVERLPGQESMEVDWWTIGECADGSALVMNVGPLKRGCGAIARIPRKRWWGRGREQVLAGSFTELLERLLESGGKPLWTNVETMS